MYTENHGKACGEKKLRIIDAALGIFGRSGYKKASIGDIAEAAGFSKAMIFYYFGSKKNLYAHLLEFCRRQIFEHITMKMDMAVTDFFGRMRMISEIKTKLILRHPNMVLFLKSMYIEADPDIRGEVESFAKRNREEGTELFFSGLDMSRFKADVDPFLLMRFLTWASEGFAYNFAYSGGTSYYNEYINDFYKYLELMKKHLYKNRHNLPEGDENHGEKHP